MAKARRRDLRDACAEEKSELEAQLQAEAEANAALRRGLKKAAAVTAARGGGVTAAEKVSVETATSKAGEARAAHRAQVWALKSGRAEQPASVVA